MAMQMISWWTRLGIVIVCVFFAWLLSGCSMLGDSAEDAVENATTQAEEQLSDEELYNKAADYLNENRYQKAIEAFEEVDRQHPYSEWAKRAQVMAAYSAYRAQLFDEAALMLQRFVKLHPSDEQIDYAYYLRALCYYDQITDVGRDQDITEKARQALKDVIARFDDSQYARDAAIKLELTEDHLAGKEMQIGRYYLKRKAYVSAANRFQYVIKHYQTTSHTPEALHRLVETYLRLGVRPEAQKYAAVLGHNYPGSQWYQYSYQMLNGQLDPNDSVDAPDEEDGGMMDWLF